MFMYLGAIILCLGFIACSNDDNDEDNDEKIYRVCKITAHLHEDEDENETRTYSYDGQGRKTKCTYEENNIDTNINILDISNLINLLDTLSTTEIKIKMLPGNLTPTGDWVPDNARVEQEINDMFPPVPEDTAKDAEE